VDSPRSPYAVPLVDLEASVRVARSEQVVLVPDHRLDSAVPVPAVLPLDDGDGD